MIADSCGRYSPAGPPTSGCVQVVLVRDPHDDRCHSGQMAHGLDVVAVGVAHERAVVVGVVLGPHPRLVQHLGTGRDRGVEERPHRGAIGRDERDVVLAVRRRRWCCAPIQNVGLAVPTP